MGPGLRLPSPKVSTPLAVRPGGLISSDPCSARHDVAPPCLQALRAAPAPRRPAAAGPAAAPALRASRLDGVEMAPPDPILVRICNLPMIIACVGKIVAPIAQHCGSKRQFSGCGWLVGGHC